MSDSFLLPFHLFFDRRQLYPSCEKSSSENSLPFKNFECEAGMSSSYKGECWIVSPENVLVDMLRSVVLDLDRREKGQSPYIPCAKDYVIYAFYTGAVLERYSSLSSFLVTFDVLDLRLDLDVWMLKRPFAKVLNEVGMRHIVTVEVLTGW